MVHEHAADGSSSRCHYFLVFITVIFFAFISKYYLQRVRNTFHLGVLLKTAHWCIRLIYNGQEFPFFWTLGYWFSVSGAITTHWLTNKPVDVFSFGHVILDKYRSFCKANTRLILSPAPSHRPAACVATHWSATLTTGHHHPSLRLAKHLFMAWGAATGRRLQLSQDCYSEDKVHLHKPVNVFSSFTSHMNKQQAWSCSHEDSSNRETDNIVCKHAAGSASSVTGIFSVKKLLLKVRTYYWKDWTNTHGITKIHTLTLGMTALVYWEAIILRE